MPLGLGEGAVKEARSPTRTVAKIRQVFAEDPAGRWRGAKRAPDRPQPRNQQEYRPQCRKTAQASRINSHSRSAWHRIRRLSAR